LERQFFGELLCNHTPEWDIFTDEAGKTSLVLFSLYVNTFACYFPFSRTDSGSMMGTTTDLTLIDSAAAGAVNGAENGTQSWLDTAPSGSEAG
jgi:hypothetical protein